VFALERCTWIVRQGLSYGGPRLEEGSNKNMSSGQITRLMKDRGFGFIKSETSSEEVFFHATSLNAVTFDELHEGENVEFDVEADPRNPSRSRAANVRRSA